MKKITVDREVQINEDVILEPGDQIRVMNESVAGLHAAKRFLRTLDNTTLHQFRQEVMNSLLRFPEYSWIKRQGFDIEDLTKWLIKAYDDLGDLRMGELKALLK